MEASTLINRATGSLSSAKKHWFSLELLATNAAPLSNWQSRCRPVLLLKGFYTDFSAFYSQVLSVWPGTCSTRVFRSVCNRSMLQMSNFFKPSFGLLYEHGCHKYVSVCDGVKPKIQHGNVQHKLTGWLVWKSRRHSPRLLMLESLIPPVKVHRSQPTTKDHHSNHILACFLCWLTNWKIKFLP